METNTWSKDSQQKSSDFKAEILSEAEFKEFEPRLKSSKTRV